MSECFVVALEGLFATKDLEILEHQREIYKLLSVKRMIVLSTNPFRVEVDKFLRKYHFRHDLLLTKDATSILTDQEWKTAQVRNVKATGWPVDFYFDSDPTTCRSVFSEGTAVMLLAHRLMRPDWLPDSRNPKPWNELVEFIEEQQQAKADPPDSGRKLWEQPVVP